MTPLEYLVRLIEAASATGSIWAKGPYIGIKALSTTEKGDIAEKFVVSLAQHHGLEAIPNESKRGEYDVMVADKKLEVKMASEDVSGNFQFNGIRYDRKYDMLCVIGISPDAVRFNIYPKSEVTTDLTLVAMQKNTNATYKLTRKKSELLDLAEFPKFFK